MKEKQDNIVSFVGMNDLFVNTDIDVTPTKKNYNIMFLKGNNIVINGDIEIFAYGFYRNTALQISSMGMPLRRRISWRGRRNSTAR